MNSIFYLGQKVVAKRDHSKGMYKKGQKFTVLNIDTSCCNPNIQIFDNVKNGMLCSHCGKPHDKLKGYFDQNNFSPIIEKSNFTYIDAIELIGEKILILK